MNDSPDELVHIEQEPPPLVVYDATLVEQLGQEANQHAARSAFEDYRGRKAAETLRHQDAALNSFSTFLQSALGNRAPTGEALAGEPSAWQGISWGLVEAFVRWQLAEGYALATVNARLSTVRTYAKLASKAGSLSVDELNQIRNVQGYRQREGKEINRRREVSRRGDKKAEPVRISLEQARALKAQPDTPQGKRDSLLMSLLLDHGLRVSEVADLRVENLDPAGGKLVFHRRKVDRTQTHALTRDTLRAAIVYLPYAPTTGPLLRSSQKDGELVQKGMSVRAIRQRVEVLGRAIGLEGLSPHDCRHYWASNAARAGTDAFALRDAGGWSSLAMPGRYVEHASVANRDVKLET